MPSPKKANTTKMLVQIEAELHAKADQRRRREKTNWSRVITELLRRWTAGANDAALAAPVRSLRVRTTGPSPEEFRAWSEKKKQDDPAYRRAATERVDPASINWHTSLAAVFREEALMKGKALPAGALEALDEDDDGARDV
jgi:hypothetical protein